MLLMYNMHNFCDELQVDEGAATHA